MCPRHRSRARATVTHNWCSTRVLRERHTPRTASSSSSGSYRTTMAPMYRNTRTRRRYSGPGHCPLISHITHPSGHFPAHLHEYAEYSESRPDPDDLANRRQYDCPPAHAGAIEPEEHGHVYNSPAAAGIAAEDGRHDVPADDANGVARGG